MSAPHVPILTDLSRLSDQAKVVAIQNYIEEFQYNYSGTSFVKLNKKGGSNHIKLAVQKLIQMSLPIQCVEAVFMGCYLTADISSSDRLPLSFKSVFRGNTHRHIVLAVRLGGRWGALGLSRRNCLMRKDFKFDSLCDLIRDYDESYKKCFHTLVTLYLGFPLPRSFWSATPIMWKAVKIRIFGHDYRLIENSVNSFCEVMIEKGVAYYEQKIRPPIAMK